jgi:D-aminopeptidase
MGSLREHGLQIGRLEAGPRCSIADVAGVAVGHVTVVRDEPEPPNGRGVARTGVTAVVPGALPLRAGVAVLNGAGEMTGAMQIAEWGVVETPVYLTATMAVGRVFDGAVAAAVAADPAIGLDEVVIPVVAECDDSWLSEARVVQVEAVLVLANFGHRRELRVDGVPVGRLLGGEVPVARPQPAGSCIVVVATDAPLHSAQLTRVARRAGLGLARTGSTAHHGSGEIFLALSTAGRADEDCELDPISEATADATEEAVLNALWSAQRVQGRRGRVADALPHDAVLELLERHRRLGVR